MTSKRAILIVLDSVGIGAAPDAHLYNDEGSNTLCNIASAQGGLKLRNLAAFGLGNIERIKGVEPVSEPQALCGLMAPRSPGKDTITGHWEIAGIILQKPFPVYPHGFPEVIIKAFVQAIGRGILGNKPASGTEIIHELGRLHLETGKPIVYTSADSVFQIAAHEEVVPLKKLYSWCKEARKILRGDHAVARVIARPFRGSPGNFERTKGRKDFTLPPMQESLLDLLHKNGWPVIGFGKINDIFAGRGLQQSIKFSGNEAGLQKLLQTMEEVKQGLLFINLVDFDTLYGHRNDVCGYAQALEYFDQKLPLILDKMQKNDLLVITADHGCDPTFPGTDHTREYAPFFIYRRGIKGRVVGKRETFADLGATVANYFGLSLQNGTPIDLG
ncbi:MAG: phosphopentomutase [Dethiobacteria bacterium]